MVKDPIKAKRFCSICIKHLNKKNPHVQCSICRKYSHISCININYPDAYAILNSYSWECHSCKKCSICNSASDTKANCMLFCDRCDKGFHMRCLNPPLKKEPEGKWLCDSCVNELNKEDKVVDSGKKISENKGKEKLKGKDKEKFKEKGKKDEEKELINKQEKIPTLNLNFNNNTISKIQIPLKDPHINILKPKHKSTTISNQLKDQTINELQPKSKQIMESSTDDQIIHVLQPKRKSEIASSVNEKHINILQPKRKSLTESISKNGTSSSFNSEISKPLVKRIFIKVPPRKKLKIVEDDLYDDYNDEEDEEDEIDIYDEEENEDDNKNIELYDNEEDEEDIDIENEEDEEEEEEEEEEDDEDEDDEDEDEEDYIDIEGEDEEFDIETIDENEYDDDIVGGAINEENESEEDEEDEDDEDEDDDDDDYYGEYYEDDDCYLDEEEKTTREKEKALRCLKEKYKELRKIVEQLSRNTVDSKKMKKEHLQNIIDKVRSISLKTNIKIPLMSVTSIRSVIDGLKYIENQFTNSSPLDDFDASILGRFGPLESISPIVNSEYNLKKSGRKRKRNEPYFSSIDDRIRYNNPILANTIFSRDTQSKKTNIKYDNIPLPSTNFNVLTNSRSPVKIVNNTLVKKASQAIREYLGEEGADTTLCMPDKNDYKFFIGLNKEIEEYRMKSEDLKILYNNPEFLNDENEELKKAKKILEANKQEENFTLIDEYSEQILKADQSLKEDCIKPVDISKNKAIKFGSYLIKMWFASPYPAEYSERPILYLCEYCFKYLNSEYALMRHQKKCPIKVPPGNEIYRDNNISIFEVDGRKNKIYCQNLCLLSKLFLDHKTLYYDVEPFLFYIMTLPKSQKYKFVGYFSKEKQCESNYNLSCLLTLPIYQRKGYGNALIAFSYMLSKIEGKSGSPEKPLSDFGLRSYRKYWRYNVFKALTELHFMDDELNIEEISRMTSITENDILCTLYNSGLLKRVKSNKVTPHYKFGISGLDLYFFNEKDNDFLLNKKYELFIDAEKVYSYVKDEEAKIKIKLDPKYLRWNLYNMPLS